MRIQYDDEEGYPTEHALELIKTWPWQDTDGCFNFIRQMWQWNKIMWLTKWPDKALFAGASLEEFITFIEECGGTVYLPKEKNNGKA